MMPPETRLGGSPAGGPCLEWHGGEGCSNAVLPSDTFFEKVHLY